MKILPVNRPARAARFFPLGENHDWKAPTVENTTMLFIVTGIWIVSTWLTFSNERRGLALASLLLGGALSYGLFAGKVGFPGLALLAVLTVILVIINKFDMS